MNDDEETNNNPDDQSSTMQKETEQTPNPSPTNLSKTAIIRAKDWSRNYLTKHLATTSIVILGITTLGALTFGVYTHRELSKERIKTSELSRNLNERQNSLNDSNQPENIIATVGKLIILPENEKPTIATVTDLAKLQNQPFFNNAEIGDKVLIYTQSKKAILFRPSTSRIIEYAPLQMDESTNTEGSVAGATTKSPKKSKK